MKSLKELGEMTVALNNEGRSRELLDQIYSDTVQSCEAAPMPDGAPGVTGLDALKAKWDGWESANEVHTTRAEGPFFHGEDRFGVIYEVDLTERATGERSTFRELALYTVAEGKVVLEEFFY